eukprot:1148251-Pelagomonas_calceolata.AAC.2
MMLCSGDGCQQRAYGAASRHRYARKRERRWRTSWTCVRKVQEKGGSMRTMDFPAPRPKRFVRSFFSPYRSNKDVCTLKMRRGSG